MNCCILLSTCDKNARLAALTLKLISSRWNAHPPVISCGSTMAVAADHIALECDPSDWVGITLHAVDVLLQKKYRQCYLILDDHPPFGVCHSDHLNITIPRLMQELRAACISLYGWDQRTVSSGEILGRECCFLQRQRNDFQWRFSLHPALWDLEMLRGILCALEPMPGNPASRSIWAFERRSGSADLPVPAQWNNACYRVCGLNMLGGSLPMLRRWTRLMEFRYYDLRRWSMHRFAGKDAVNRFDAKFAYRYAFYDGPYPMFWSGVLRKGAIHSDLVRFLQCSGKNEELNFLFNAVEL